MNFPLRQSKRSLLFWDKDDSSEEGQTVSSARPLPVQIGDGTNSVSVQHPLPTDGDSVYYKDIWLEESTSTDFSGLITDLFDNLHSQIVNTTTDNPKTILMHFNRTVVGNTIGLGNTGGGDFSNVKIEIINSGGVAVTVIDESSSNVKYTTRTFQLPVTAGYNALRITFHTADTISLTNCVILKTRSVVARLQGVKNDNTVVDFNATNAGNFKVSLEEFDEAFNTLPLPVRTVPQDDFRIDAFGRMRVSNTDQRFDAEFIYDKQPFLFNEVLTGLGTATHNTDSRDITLRNISVATGDGARMIQHWHNPYTPGNSQLIDITGTLNEANITGGTASIFLTNGIDGTETEINQADWDYPNLDINWNFSQILQMDFQSLKIGTIGFNLVRNKIPTRIHQIHNDNIRAGGYWQYPAQPVRWEIYNTATETITEMAYSDGINGIGFRYRVPLNATQEMRAVCVTVKSEGGGHVLDMPGFPFLAENLDVTKTVSTTLIPIISIRSAETFNSLVNNTLAILERFEISTDNPIKFVITYRPTLVGDSFVPVDTNSAIEYDISATSASGGTIVEAGVVATDRNTDAGKGGLLGRTIMSKGNNGVVDILTISAIRTSTSNANVGALLKWKEIR